MALGIFLSYRRSDSKAETQRLYDSLTARFGAEAEIFMDVDKIPFGRDWVTYIDETMDRSDVAIVVIGPDWSEVKNPDGGRRLEAADDRVRHEIRSAFSGDRLVIPVFVRGARVPDEASLPEDIRRLHRFNGLRLDDETWDADVDRIVASIRRELDSAIDPDVLERLTAVATRHASAVPESSLVAVCELDERIVYAAAFRRGTGGFELAAPVGRIRDMGQRQLDTAVYLSFRPRIHPQIWEKVRTDPDWGDIDALLRRAASQARASLARGESGTLRLPTEPEFVLTIDGNDVHDVVRREADRAIDLVRGTVRTAGDGDLTAVCLAGAAGYTESFVDVARSRFGFENVKLDIEAPDETRPLSSPISIDQMVGKKRLVANEALVAFGDVEIPTAAADGVAYWKVTTSINGVHTETARCFVVAGGGREIRFALDHRWSKEKSRADDETWLELINLSSACIEPRLLDRMFERLRGGASVEIGPLTIGPNAVTKKGAFKRLTYLPWSAYDGTEVRMANVFVRSKKAKAGRSGTFATVEFKVVNAVLLPTVLDFAHSLFGG